MLYIEAIPRALLGADYFSSSLGIFLLVCNVFQFICFFVINYFTIHFFTLRVPNSYIPWAQVENRVFLLKTGLKMWLVI